MTDRIKKAAKPKKPAKRKPKKPDVTVTVEQVEEKRRADEERNAQMISEAFYSLAIKKKKLPTITDLSKETGLCYKTIQRHIKKPSFKEALEILRGAQDKMLITFMGKVSSSGNPRMWELYWMLTEPEFKQRVSIDHSNNGGKFEAPQTNQIDISKAKPEQLRLLLKIKKELGG